MSTSINVREGGTNWASEASKTVGPIDYNRICVFMEKLGLMPRGTHPRMEVFEILTEWAQKQTPIDGVIAMHGTGCQWVVLAQKRKSADTPCEDNFNSVLLKELEEFRRKKEDFKRNVAIRDNQARRIFEHGKNVLLEAVRKGQDNAFFHVNGELLLVELPQVHPDAAEAALKLFLDEGLDASLDHLLPSTLVKLAVKYE